MAVPSAELFLLALIARNTLLDVFTESDLIAATARVNKRMQATLLPLRGTKRPAGVSQAGRFEYD